MRAFLSLFIIFSLFFTTCSAEAFSLFKSKKAPVGNSVVETTLENDSSVNTTKAPKIKQQKLKKEKVKKEKTLKEKTIKKSTAKNQKKKSKQQNVSKTYQKQDNEEFLNNTELGSTSEPSQKTKAKKNKKDKKIKQDKMTDKSTVEKATDKKRTFIGRFLNPNLDIYEIRASHILVKKRKDAVSIRKDILNGDITFEEAAKRYSLCPTGPYGGDLGYFTRRKMDQLFSDTAFDLKIGEISDPVGTKFGWHLIKVVDKR